MISWTPDAIADVDAATLYGMDRWPVQALQLADDIIDAVAVLGEYPHIGREGAKEGTRELIVQGYPFHVVYAVTGRDVTILHVNHQNMAWPERRPA